MSDIEKRRSPRSTVALPVVVRAGAESASGQVKSISRLGALIESEKPFAVGTALHLLVLVEPPDKHLEIRGQVVRVDTAGGVLSLGIMFAPLANAVLATLESLAATSSVSGHVG